MTQQPGSWRLCGLGVWPECLLNSNWTEIPGPYHDGPGEETENQTALPLDSPGSEVQFGFSKFLC